MTLSVTLSIKRSYMISAALQQLFTHDPLSFCKRQCSISVALENTLCFCSLALSAALCRTESVICLPVRYIFGQRKYQGIMERLVPRPEQRTVLMLLLVSAA